MARTQSGSCKRCGKLREKWADEGSGADYYCCPGCTYGSGCDCLANAYQGNAETDGGFFSRGRPITARSAS